MREYIKEIQERLKLNGKVLMLKPRCIGKLNMVIYYKLDENNNVITGTPEEVEEFLSSPRKIVKQEDVGIYWVSTVFLCIDHRYSFSREESPIVFETMITTNGDWDDFQQRYCTSQEALAGHNEIVEKLKQGVSLYDD